MGPVPAHGDGTRASTRPAEEELSHRHLGDDKRDGRKTTGDSEFDAKEGGPMGPWLAFALPPCWERQTFIAAGVQGLEMEALISG